MSEKTFEWNEEVLGVRPTEGQYGSYGDRQTYLAPCLCPCGQPTSYYLTPENGEEYEVCEAQTEYLREEAAREFVESLMAEDDGEGDGDVSLFDMLDLLFGSGMTIVEIGPNGMSLTTIMAVPVGEVEDTEEINLDDLDDFGDLKDLFDGLENLDD